MAKSIKLGDGVFLDPSGIKHQIISTIKTAQAVANQFVYTGVSVAIPANCEYELAFECVYNQNDPTGICLARNDQSIALQYLRYDYAEDRATAFISGYTASGFTVYLWGRWSASTPNGCTVNGILRTYS